MILKGYHDYENKTRQFEEDFIRVSAKGKEVTTEVVADAVGVQEVVEEIPVKKKKSRKSFLDAFKTNLIEMFKEEDDTRL